MGARSFPCLQKPEQLLELASYKARGGRAGAGHREPRLWGRSWAGPSAGTARARGAANQRPARAGRRGPRGAGSHRRPARAAGGKLEVPPPPPRERARVWRPLPTSGSPFPPPNPRPYPGQSEGKSRCAGTCEQPYLSSALALLFFFQEGCAGERRTVSGRGRRGTFPVTQVSPFPSPTPSLFADGRRSGLQLSGWAGAGAWAPALGSRSRREKARKGRGWPGRGVPSRARLESAGTDREGSAVAGGLTPWSQRAGIAPVRAVREPQREPGAAPLRTFGVSAPG